MPSPLVPTTANNRSVPSSSFGDISRTTKKQIITIQQWNVVDKQTQKICWAKLQKDTHTKKNKIKMSMIAKSFRN